MISQKTVKIAFYTLGCKLNQAETDELKKTLIDKGFLAVPVGAHENIAIIRACAVTCNASQTTRGIIRRAKRKGAHVVATGCLENKDLKEIDFLAKNNEEIISHCEEYRKNQCGEANSANLNLKSPSYQTLYSIDKERSRTRAFIKIQTGCNFRCAYCIIPSFRGISKSLPAEEIIKKINTAVKNGYKEVILTGVNIGLYKNANYDLADLLKKILDETKIQRIRLGSLDPRLISKKLIELYTRDNKKTIKQNKRERLLPHWHLSLQSGSNYVLKQMNRGYTTEKYKKIVNKLRIHYPLFSFTTDIIVGFPGETEEEFKQTGEFVKKIKFTKIHIFPFSPRPNTPANKLKTLNNKIITERVKILTTIATDSSKKYAENSIGLKKSILFENKTGAYFYGYTPEYLRIRSKFTKNVANKIKRIKITAKNLVIQ